MATEEIKTILVGEGYVFGDTLHIGREPSSPNRVITLFDTPDRGPALFADKKDGPYNYLGVQVRIRNSSYKDGKEEAKEIHSILHNRGNEIINGVKITLIKALDNPSLLDWDENDRPRFVINFTIQQTTIPST